MEFGFIVIQPNGLVNFHLMLKIRELIVVVQVLINFMGVNKQDFCILKMLMIKSFIILLQVVNNN